MVMMMLLVKCGVPDSAATPGKALVLSPIVVKREGESEKSSQIG